MYNLLAFADHTKTVEWLSISALIILALALVVIAVFAKKLNTRTIVLGGILIACSFVLSLIKIPLGLFGGSITIASFVPIVLFAFAAGIGPGLVAGLVFGLLQFISDPYIFTAWTFVLDYVLAFMSIGLAGLFGKMKNKNAAILIATLVVYLVRLSFATLSGIKYFEAGWVVDGLPTSSAFLYSVIYNMIYILPDMIICEVVFVVMIVSNAFTRILKAMKITPETSVKPATTSNSANLD